MAKVSIIKATAAHAEYIAKNVRDADKQEIWAIAMRNPEEAMLNGIEISDKSFTGMVDGVPVCMWGIVEQSIIGPVGTPWMIASNKLDQYAKLFIRQCKKRAHKYFSAYGLLENYIDARNTKAIQWLKWLGFSVEDVSSPYGALGMPFHRFTMGAKNV